jgi:SAM domain (Sterile alpha motif)
VLSSIFLLVIFTPKNKLQLTKNHSPVLALALLEWLISIEMEQYVDIFKRNGFDTKTTLTILDDAMLEIMGITAMAHKTLILKSLNKK